eukprot:g3316.t1
MVAPITQADNGTLVRVTITSNSSTKILEGRVRFAGLTRFATGKWIGVELKSAVGRNDGSVAGHRYFNCKPRFGLFAREKNVVRLSDIESDVDNPRDVQVIRYTKKRRKQSNVSEDNDGENEYQMKQQALSSSLGEYLFDSDNFASPLSIPLSASASGANDSWFSHENGSGANSKRVFYRLHKGSVQVGFPPRFVECTIFLDTEATSSNCVLLRAYEPSTKLSTDIRFPVPFTDNHQEMSWLLDEAVGTAAHEQGILELRAWGGWRSYLSDNDVLFKILFALEEIDRNFQKRDNFHSIPPISSPLKPNNVTLRNEFHTMKSPHHVNLDQLTSTVLQLQTDADQSAEEFARRCQEQLDQNESMSELQISELQSSFDQERSMLRSEIDDARDHIVQLQSLQTPKGVVAALQSAKRANAELYDCREELNTMKKTVGIPEWELSKRVIESSSKIIRLEAAAEAAKAKHAEQLQRLKKAYIDEWRSKKDKNEDDQFWENEKSFDVDEESTSLTPKQLFENYRNLSNESVLRTGSSMSTLNSMEENLRAIDEKQSKKANELARREAKLKSSIAINKVRQEEANRLKAEYKSLLQNHELRFARDEASALKHVETEFALALAHRTTETEEAARRKIADTEIKLKREVEMYMKKLTSETEEMKVKEKEMRTKLEEASNVKLQLQEQEMKSKLDGEFQLLLAKAQRDGDADLARMFAESADALSTAIERTEYEASEREAKVKMELQIEYDETLQELSHKAQSMHHRVLQSNEIKSKLRSEINELKDKYNMEKENARKERENFAKAVKEHSFVMQLQADQAKRVEVTAMARMKAELEEEARIEKLRLQTIIDEQKLKVEEKSGGIHFQKRKSKVEDKPSLFNLDNEALLARKTMFDEQEKTLRDIFAKLPSRQKRGKNQMSVEKEQTRGKK